MTKTRGRDEKINHDLDLISTLLEFTAEYQIFKIVRLIVEKLPRLVGAKDASLFWLDRDNNSIVLQETYPGNRHNIGKRVYAVGEGLTGWVAQTGRPLRIKDITNEKELERIDPKPQWIDKFYGFRKATRWNKEHQRAFLAVPIIMDEQTMGVLRIAKTLQPNYQFSQKDEKFLVTVAEHLAAILKKAQFLESVRNFQSLFEPSFFQSPQAIDGYLKWAVNLIPAIMNCRGCTIFLKDESSGSFVLKYCSRGNPLFKRVGIACYYKDEGLTGWVLSKGESLRINDIEDKSELERINPDLRWKGKYKEFMEHHSNFLAAPILTANEVYGVIRLSKGSRDIPFSKDDEELLNRYAFYLGAALASLHQYGTVIVRPSWKNWYPVIDNLCFVLMPFSQRWSKNVKRIIKMAVESQGFIFRIADEQTGRIVMEDVWKGVCEARLIIADISTGNANVAYEVGMADVLGKKVILLSQDPKKAPFDFAGARQLKYSLNHLDQLQDDLANRITQMLEPTNKDWVND